MAIIDTAPAAQPEGPFGHPRGLMTLFFTEMWERFSYYGMRAILVLFMTAAVAEGGLGFGPEKAGPIYAMYTSLAYLASVPGGWLADNFLGQRRSVLIGGVIIMLGHVSLALHGLAFFFTGLGLVIAGTGLLKPNISVIVGQLYSKEDHRRDAGFSIFYMGINLGAFLAPFACGYLAEKPHFRALLEGWGLDPKDSWHWGFGAAAVGMFFGLVQYLVTGRTLGAAGLHPAPQTAETAARNRRTLAIGVGLFALGALGIALLALDRPDWIQPAFTVMLLAVVAGFFGKLLLGGDWTRSERARLVTIFALFCAASIFWSIFEQAGSTLTLFAARNTDNTAFGHSFPASWWQSVNAVFLVLLAPVVGWVWLRLGKRNPSYPTKFGFGLVLAGLGYALLALPAPAAQAGRLVGPGWLLSVYLLHTLGELCLSPVGLSSMTKLAPARIVSLMMGIWFLSISVGSFIGGSISGYYERFDLGTLFGVVGACGVVSGLAMFALVVPIRNMLARSAEAGSAAA
jgi:POT family proton-dependent oligopeptide transporter